MISKDDSKIWSLLVSLILVLMVNATASAMGFPVAGNILFIIFEWAAVFLIASQWPSYYTMKQKPGGEDLIQKLDLFSNPRKKWWHIWK